MVVWLPIASPYSAPGVLVMTLYSLTPSTPIVVPMIDELLIPKKPIVFAPSSMYEFEWIDMPLLLMVTPVVMTLPMVVAGITGVCVTPRCIRVRAIRFGPDVDRYVNCQPSTTASDLL